MSQTKLTITAALFVLLAVLMAPAGSALAHGGGGGGHGGGGFGGGSAHFGGGGGGFGGSSFSARSLGSMNFGSSGMSRGMNLGSSSRNFGDVGKQFSNHQFSTHDFSGQSLKNDRIRDFTGSNPSRGNLPSSSTLGGDRGRNIASITGKQFSAQHASWNKNWENGQHLSQLNHDHLANNGQFHNGQWHNGNFNNWNHWNNWNRFHNCFVVAPFWFPWWFGGFGNCFSGFGYYGYGAPYCYDTAFYPAAYDTPVDETVAYATNSPDASQLQQQQDAQQTINPSESTDSQAGAEFFAQAGDAFQSGKYRDALRLANHAAVESPQNPKAPELMSLSLFALGEFRDAAAQAHVALALGPPGDWANLYGYYGELSPYTNQLRALEKYVKDSPSAPDGHFLLAYHYLMTGYNADALKELREVTKLAPNDRLASSLVKKYSGDKSSEVIVPPPPSPTVSGSSSGASPAKPLIPPQRNESSAPADQQATPVDQ